MGRYENVVREEIEKAFAENDRAAAYLYGILMMHILHSDYVIIDANAITNNPLPLGDIKFIVLLRTMANILERLNNEKNSIQDEAEQVLKSLKQMMREM